MSLNFTSLMHLNALSIDIAQAYTPTRPTPPTFPTYLSALRLSSPSPSPPPSPLPLPPPSRRSNRQAALQHIRAKRTHSFISTPSSRSSTSSSNDDTLSGVLEKRGRRTHRVVRRRFLLRAGVLYNFNKDGAVSWKLPLGGVDVAWEIGGKGRVVVKGEGGRCLVLLCGKDAETWARRIKAEGERLWFVGDGVEQEEQEEQEEDVAWQSFRSFAKLREVHAE